MHVIRCAIQRINHPAVRGIASSYRETFFAAKTMVGVSPANKIVNRNLGRLIRLGDQV